MESRKTENCTILGVLLSARTKLSQMVCERCADEERAGVHIQAVYGLTV